MLYPIYTIGWKLFVSLTIVTTLLALMVTPASAQSIPENTGNPLTSSKAQLIREFGRFSDDCMLQMTNTPDRSDNNGAIERLQALRSSGQLFDRSFLIEVVQATVPAWIDEVISESYTEITDSRVGGDRNRDGNPGNDDPDCFTVRGTFEDSGPEDEPSLVEPPRFKIEIDFNGQLDQLPANVTSIISFPLEIDVLVAIEVGEGRTLTTTDIFNARINADALDVFNYSSGSNPFDGPAPYRRIDGSPGDETIDGSAQNDSINGMAGDDTLYGGAGNDILDGGAGNDRVFGEAGNDIIVVDPVEDDILDGGIGYDTLDASGFPGRLFINTRGEITVSSGIVATAGFERFLGGQFNDDINGSHATDDTLNGGAGDDRLWGRNGADILIGDTGNDRLYGQNNNDILRGGAGADKVYGGNGDDIISGGDGNDHLWGNAGRDIFEWSAITGGKDRLRDFNPLEDTIRFTSNAVTGYSDLQFLNSSNRLMVRDKTDGTSDYILIEGFRLGDQQVSWFEFN